MTIVGGDSGAWVIQNDTHRVIGHVLAWCERNHITYICPMEVLLEDIKRTLGAKRIYLPGSAEEAKNMARLSKHRIKHEKEDSKIEGVKVAFEGLGIVDPTVERVGMGVPARSRLGLPPLQTSGDSDKENMSVLRSRVIKVKEGRGGQLGVVSVTP
jgi:hypothetical protein